MGKREITQEKMIRAAIEIGANEGIKAITTQRIAKHCGIAEGTIFFYFKTFKDLLPEAFMYINRQMAANLGAIGLDIFDELDDRKAAYTIWRIYLEFWMERHLEARYYTAFFRSPLYDYKVHTITDTEASDFYPKFRELMESRHIFDEAYGKIGYLNIWPYIINATIDFAIKMSSGQMDSSEETKVFIFELIFERLFTASATENVSE